jgi:methyl-accepting chemotaxis protein
MAGRTDGERIDRLEQVVQIIAEDQVSLQKLIGELATETRRGFDRVAQQFQEIGERMRQTDERMRQTDDRARALDDRVDKLVIAIGELIRRQDAARL